MKRSLNSGQVAVLSQLFKFRYATRALLAESLGKPNGTALYSRLTILQAKGYIGVRYEQSYRLLGKPAAYCLTPKGLRALREPSGEDTVSEAVIKSSYKDVTTSEQFIARHLAIFSMHNSLAAHYPALKFFTKRDLASYGYFPTPIPDAYLVLGGGKQPKRFFLEYIDPHTPSFALNRRLRQFIDHAESDEWEATGTKYPATLLVCPDSASERQIMKRASRLLRQTESDLSVYATILAATANLSSGSPAIWSNVTEPDELLALENIS